jgi:hypothetical protein
MNVEVGDVFKRNGATMRIICNDRKNDIRYSIIGLILAGEDQNEEIAYFRAEDIEAIGWTKATPWDDFEIDEPVLVQDDVMTGWEKRHFAGVSKDGRPMAWLDGKTSFTSEQESCRWWNCRRPTEEERQK